MSPIEIASVSITAGICATLCSISVPYWGGLSTSQGHINTIISKILYAISLGFGMSTVYKIVDQKSNEKII